MSQRYMVFCRECSYLGSIDKGGSVPSCPECGTKLFFPEVSTDTWIILDDERKVATKSHWRDGKKGINMSVEEIKELQQARFTAEEEKKRECSNILISSGFNFEGYRIVKYSGYISGDDACQIPRTGLFGGNNNGQNLTDALAQIRRQALKELKEAAYDLGCNAVIGVDFDYITLEPETAHLGGGTLYEPYIICVTANGNAVIIEKE